MPEEATGGLVVAVRRIDEPSLWCWEIRLATGDVLESSWATHWVGYTTREDAEAAGRRRLQEVTETTLRRAS